MSLEVISYFFAVLIGIALGLVGGGGSILTVPILVYVVGVNPVVATAYSLFVVGFTSLLGSINYAKNQLVSFKAAFIFSIPSFISVFLVRKFVVPAIPAQVFSIGNFVFTKQVLLMVFFAILMLFASFSMIKSKNRNVEAEVKSINYHYPIIFIEGLIVGAITGLVGAGGGFMIIPALVLLANLPMKLAVGTSLLIIATKSLIGFLGDVSNMESIDWNFLLIFTACASMGIFIGTYLSKFISAQKLKSGFGYFLLVMSVYILLKELVVW